MAYETGTATGPADLVAKLATFLTTTGSWTQDKSAGAGDTIERYLNDGASFYISFDTAADDIFLYPNTGFDTGELVDEQPGSAALNNSWSGRMHVMTGSYTAYHFFLDEAAPDGDQVTVVVEQDPDVFRMFSFGTLEKFGTYDGGQYVSHDAYQAVTGTSSGATLRGGLFGQYTSGSFVDHGVVRVGGLDGQASEDWLGQKNVTAPNHSPNNSGFKMTWSTVSTPISGFNAFPALFFGNHTVKASYSTFWPFNPICCYIGRPITNGDTPPTYSIAGRVRNIFEINMKNFDNGEVEVVGADDYLIFSRGRKTDNSTTATQPNMFRLGFAINRDL